MNKIWLCVLLASMGVLLFQNPNAVLTALSVGSNRAVRLSLELCAVYAVWSGVLKILEETGIANALCKVLSPLIDFLFGKDLTQKAKQYISLNMSANILGMGGAATPMGIKAIEAMNTPSSTATPGMIMLVVLCSTSLQLIPTSVIGLLADNGSTNPTSILLPSILSSTISTVCGVLLVKIFTRVLQRKSEPNRKKTKQYGQAKNFIDPIKPTRRKKQKVKTRAKGAGL